MNKRKAKKFLARAERDLRTFMREITNEVISEANANLPPQSQASYKTREGKAGIDIELLIATVKAPYVANSSEHWRRLPHKTVRVRQHFKTYKAGYMPVHAGNNRWYTVNIDDYDFAEPLKEAWAKVSKKLGKRAEPLTFQSKRR